MFWTDFEQAQQRLRGTIVMYDGSPFYIENVRVSEDDPEEFVAHGGMVNDRGVYERHDVNLEDEGWNDFRNLPALGYVNTPTHLYHIARLPARTVKHGHGGGNTRLSYVQPNGGLGRVDQSVTNFATSVKNGKWYKLACQKVFPSFKDALDNLDLHPQMTIAFSPRHYIVRDKSSGVTSMFRDQRQIGIILEDAVLLTRKNACYREELADKYEIPNIMEA